MYKLPDEIDDEQAILLSDIFPTSYMAAELAEICPGNSVAVFGCGPVGQFAIASAKLMRAGRIFAIDTIESRLEMAREQGAEIINFNEEDPVKTIKGFTNKIGVDRAIDAVGVDAEAPVKGPAKRAEKALLKEFEAERKEIAPKTNEKGDNWHPGSGPSQVLNWATESLCKAGTLSIIGVYSAASKRFPIGAAMGKNLTVKMGNCPHRTIIPQLVDLVASGVADPAQLLTQIEPIDDVVKAYRTFDTREPGWVKAE